MYVIKARRHGCVQNDSETYLTGVTGLHSQLRRSCNPVTQSCAFHCHFAHICAFSLYCLNNSYGYGYGYGYGCGCNCSYRCWHTVNCTLRIKLHWNFNQNTNFLWMKCICKCHLQVLSHFFPGLNVLTSTLPNNGGSRISATSSPPSTATTSRMRMPKKLPPGSDSAPVMDHNVAQNSTNDSTNVSQRPSFPCGGHIQACRTRWPLVGSAGNGLCLVMHGLQQRKQQTRQQRQRFVASFTS